jgi:general secretion pathway protein C
LSWTFTYPGLPGVEVDVVVVRLKALLLIARVFLLTSFAYFCALSINSVIATKLALPPSALQVENLPPPSPPQPKPPLSAYAIIYTRDLFNSVKATSGAGDTSLAATNIANLKLLGTATGTRDQAFAIFEDQSSHMQYLYREGETITPGVQLLQVGWDRVTIDREGQRETLVLPREASAPLPQSAVTPVSTSSDGKEGVRQVAPDSFHIDRREVEHAVSHLSDLFTQVRAVPYAPQNGVTQGFRLFAIKPDSLIDRIGLKNGDIVQRVNGVEITDPSTAFTLLQDMQGRSQIRVDVLRNHQPTTLSYEIR